VGVFKFNDEGKLAHYTEYFDPLTLINGFPGAAEAAMPDEQRIQRMVAGHGASRGCQRLEDHTRHLRR
jgi:hypothetical protein